MCCERASQIQSSRHYLCNCHSIDTELWLHATIVTLTCRRRSVISLSAHYKHPISYKNFARSYANGNYPCTKCVCRNYSFLPWKSLDLQQILPPIHVFSNLPSLFTKVPLLLTGHLVTLAGRNSSTPKLQDSVSICIYSSQTQQNLLFSTYSKFIKGSVLNCLAKV